MQGKAGKTYKKGRAHHGGDNVFCLRVNFFLKILLFLQAE